MKKVERNKKMQTNRKITKKKMQLTLFSNRSKLRLSRKKAEKKLSQESQEKQK